MLRITSIADEPIAELRYMNARSGGGTEVSRLAVLRGEVGPLVDELDAIICCSDLQGVVRSDLLGVAVVDLLLDLAEQGVIPRSARTGVILAGDLYSVPGADKRGGFGDVTPVWEAFAAAEFAWIVGVAGNHDDVRGVHGLASHVHLLDGDCVNVDGLRIGGVGYVIGNSKKPGRRDEDTQLGRIADVLAEGCDVLVLHEGPDGDHEQPGTADIRALIADGSVPLTVCGHRHWEAPLAELGDGQVLNVDARVVVLVAQERPVASRSRT